MTFTFHEVDLTLSRPQRRHVVQCRSALTNRHPTPDHAPTAAEEAAAVTFVRDHRTGHAVSVQGDDHVVVDVVVGECDPDGFVSNA